ncbi:MAG: hypothetical protein ACFE9I_16620 [Candidatus Hermodarchaeota archaeon]
MLKVKVNDINVYYEFHGENTGHGMNIQESELWSQKVIEFLKKE